MLNILVRTYVASFWSCTNFCSDQVAIFFLPNLVAPNDYIVTATRNLLIYLCEEICTLKW